VRALIVDDEPLARRGVILRLRRFKDVEIIGECGDGASAVEKIMSLSPDVVFLDVLKPLHDERFAAAINRARKLMDSTLKASMVERVWQMLGQTSEKYVARFTVQTGTRIQIVLADDIEWIGAAGDYVELHVSGRCHLFRETMASLEQRLDPAKFIRIHRSRIIQAANIVELQSIDNREFTVKVSDGSEHRASRTYADRLERWLSSGRT
jgi:two-component system, LytTR family, response regulator